MKIRISLLLHSALMACVCSTTTLTVASVSLSTMASVQAADVVWDAGAGTWDTESGNLPWTGNPFTSGDNVSFNGTGGVVTVNGTVDPGSVTILDENDWTLSGGTITPTGDITMNGTGNLIIKSTIDSDANLIINSGTVKLGDNWGTSVNMSVDTIQVNAGATFAWQNGHITGLQDTTLSLNGGTFSVLDSGHATGVTKLASLNVTADSSINTQFKYHFEFATLTGSANLNMTNTGTAYDYEARKLVFKRLENYTGTFSLVSLSSSLDTSFTLEINAASQAAGESAIIQGRDVYSGSGFTMSGAGSLEVTQSLIVTGDFSQTDAGTLTLGEELSVSGNFSSAGSLSAAILDVEGTVTNSGTLTITDSLQLRHTIENTGTVVFGDDIQIDLSQMTASSSVGDTSTYHIINGGTVNFASLTMDNIAVVGVTMYDIAFSPDGSVSVTDPGHVKISSGNTFTWDAAATFDDSATFSAGQSVLVTAQDTQLAVEANYTTRSIVADGITLTLSSGNGSKIDTEWIELFGDAHLRLEDDVLSPDFALKSSSTGTFTVALAAAESMTVTSELNNFAGSIVVESGTLNFNVASGQTSNMLTNISGDGIIGKTGAGTLLINASSTYTGTLHIQEGTVQLGSDWRVDLSTQFSEIIIDSGATFYWQNGINSGMADSTITLNGGTFLSRDGEGLDNPTAIGTLNIAADSTLRTDYKFSYNFNKLTGDGDLNMTNTAPGYDYEGRQITINQIENYTGTYDLSALTSAIASSFKLYVNGANQAAGESAIIKERDVHTTSSFTMQGKGSLEITKSLNVSGALIKSDAGSLTIGENLTVSSDLQQMGGSLSVGGTLTTGSFAQTGADSVSSIGTLQISNGGTLHMTYEGTVNLGAGGILLGSTANLIYGSGANLFNIGSAGNEGITQLNLSLFGIDLSNPYSLGISSSIDMSKIAISGLSSDQYTLTNVDDYWQLSLNSGSEVSAGAWDSNWGAAALADLPTSATEYTGLSDGITSGYSADLSIVSMKLTGTTDGQTQVDVVGGQDVSGAWTGGVTTNVDTWIEAVGGAYRVIAGGGHLNNWGAGAASGDFIGDSHIVIRDSADDAIDLSVGYVIGANYKEGAKPTFEGDVYISVYTDSVTGSIIGGSTTAHSDSWSGNNRGAILLGDTNIFVYTALDASGAASLTNLPNNVIAGGHVLGSGSSVPFVHEGDTHIKIDLTDYTSGTKNFSKKIVGGGHMHHSSSQYTQDGDTNVMITGHSDVTFTQTISGGTAIITNASGWVSHTGDSSVTIDTKGSSFSQAIAGVNVDSKGTYTLTGNSSVDIRGTGGQFSAFIYGIGSQGGGTTTVNGNSSVIISGDNTYSGRIVGASDILTGGNSVTVNGHTSVTISGGTFNNNILGAFNQHTGTGRITGNSSVAISGGTFTATVYAGSLHNGTSTIDGNSTLTVTGGSLAGLAGGNQLLAATSSTIDGQSSVTVGGTANVTGNVVGGMEVAGAFTGTATLRSTAVTINGGSVSGRIVGANSMNSTGSFTTGDVSVNLNSGTITGDVYAAGYRVGGTGSSVVASTKVVIGSAATLGSDGNAISISGAYGGTASANDTVTGTRRLVFDSAADYGTVNATFDSFDSIEVTEATGRVAMAQNVGNLSANLTKTGAGTVAIAADSNLESLNILSGVVELQDSSELTLGDLVITQKESTSAAQLTANPNALARSGAATINESTISNVKAENATITRSGSGNISVTNSLLVNSTLVVDNAAVTMSNTTLSGNTSVTGSSAVSYVDGTVFKASQSDTTLSASTLTSIRTLENPTEDANAHIVSLTMATVGTIDGNLLIDLTLSDSDYALWAGVLDGNNADASMLGVELVGFALDDLNVFYTELSINIKGVSGQQYGATPLEVLGYTSSLGGHLVLYIPEPSTATLSLLALAGLLARRRRRA